VRVAKGETGVVRGLENSRACDVQPAAGGEGMGGSTTGRPASTQAEQKRLREKTANTGAVLRREFPGLVTKAMRTFFIS